MYIGLRVRVQCTVYSVHYTVYSLQCTVYSVHCPLFLSDFNDTWIFSTYFRNTLKYQISWKSVEWEPSCSMRTDGQTDGHNEANSRFSQFCERA